MQAQEMVFVKCEKCMDEKVTNPVKKEGGYRGMVWRSDRVVIWYVLHCGTGDRINIIF